MSGESRRLARNQLRARARAESGFDEQEYKQHLLALEQQSQHWLLCKTAWGRESLGSRDTRSDRGGVGVRYDRPPPLRTNATTSQSKSLELVLQTVMPPLCTLEPPFTAVCSVGFSNLTSQVVTSSGSFVSHGVGEVARDWWSWLFSHRELLAVSSFLNLLFYFLFVKRSLVLVSSAHIKFKSHSWVSLTFSLLTFCSFQFFF